MKNERILKKEYDRLMEMTAGQPAVDFDPAVGLVAARDTLAWALGLLRDRPSRSFPERAPAPAQRASVDVEGVVRSFIETHRSVAQIHAIVDTAPVGGEPVPHLNLWAFAVNDPDAFAATYQRAVERDDPNLLEDVLEEVASALDCVDLSPLYRQWPDGPDEPLVEVLRRVARAVQPSARIYFGHAGALPLTQVSPDAASDQ